MTESRRDEFAWSTRWAALPEHLRGVPIDWLQDQVQAALIHLLESSGAAVVACEVEVTTAAPSDGGRRNVDRVTVLVDLVTVGWTPGAWDRPRLMNRAIRRLAGEAPSHPAVAGR